MLAVRLTEHHIEEKEQKKFPGSLVCSQVSSCRKGLLAHFSLSHSASTAHAGVTPKPLCSSSLTPTAWLWCEQASSSSQMRLKASGYHAVALLCGLDLSAWHCTRGMMKGMGPPILQRLTDEGWDPSKPTSLAPAQGQQVALPWCRKRYYCAAWTGGWALWLAYCFGRKKPGSSLCDKIQHGSKGQSFPPVTPKLQPRALLLVIFQSRNPRLCLMAHLQQKDFSRFFWSSVVFWGVWIFGVLVPSKCPNPMDRDTNAPEKQQQFRYALCSAFPIA